jgi:hypothetical protein
MAVGVLMELCGWEPTKARARLLVAANSAGTSVEALATALLVLGTEHPHH